MLKPKLRMLTPSLLLCLLVTASANAQTNVGDHTTWREYGGSADGSQYSALRQINRDNVAQLQRAWSYSTGDERKYLFNPLVVDGVMYVLAKQNSIVALDASTGKELWVHATDAHSTLLTNRGLNYWESKDRSDRRLIFALKNQLQEIDARTGKSITQFGVNGLVDLRDGLGRKPESLHLVQSYNPGRVYGDLLILGSATNEEYNSGPGDIRAYNVLTGKLVWIFHTIPHPGEPGYETWPKDAWKTVGGANSWAGLALDEKRGIVYVPTASPKYNFYGGNRHGANLYGDCLLALNARTGKLIWYYQMVHHDVWDYDNGITPMLATVMHNGKKVDIVAQVGKVGYVWVFDRVTGKPLWPIEERAVPQSDVPGEETSPTQPFPSKPPPFARQSFTAADLSPFLGDAERAQVLEQLKHARNEGLFTPPSTGGSIEMPGNNGGGNFGGATIDPANGNLYVVSKDLPSLLKLDLPNGAAAVPNESQYKSGFGFMFSSSGLPVIAPPWTSLTAYDLNTGTIRWKIPLGNVPELAAKGHADTGAHFPKTNPVLTAGGILFTGTRDRKVRAIDATTGKVLWEAEVDAALEGMPAVYEIRGREYVVFCAAAQATTYTHNVPGHAASNAPIPGAYVAFALP